jgi:hypothetical protein
MDRMRGRGQGTLATGAAIIAIAVAMAAALSACSAIHATGDVLAGAGRDVREATHLAPLGVDPSSPVAADVAAAEQTTAPIPSFASVPPKPTDVRSAAAYKGQVVDVVGARRSLSGWEAANPPLATDTEAYAEAQRAKLADQHAVSDAQQAESEAFAKKLRDAAGAPSGKAATPKKSKAAKSAPSPN